MAYLCTVAFVTAVLHSLAGFAGALLLSIAIAPAVGVKLTVPIVTVAMIISHGSRAWLFRRSVDWGIFIMLFSCALPFILLGVYTYVSLSEAAVGLFLGCLLFVTVPLQKILRNKSISIPRWAIGVVAVPYGFLSGASFGVGMLLGPFFLGAGLAGETLVATIAIQGFLLNIIKTVAFGFSPLLTSTTAAIGIVLGLCTFPGHWLGRRLLKRTRREAHTRMLEVYMLMGACYFVSRWFVAT